MIPAVVVHDLDIQLGDLTVLVGISFEIPREKFVSIVGPNGAGKSTLLKALLGLIVPRRGEVLIYGKAPKKINPDLIGYVPQVKKMDRSFPAVAAELVCTGIKQGWPWSKPREQMDRVEHALEQVGGLHLARRPLSKLSGGELQRVYLARSLVRDPKLVLLDEPATGIDSVGEADIYELLETYQKDSGATIIMITHDWHAATHHSDFVLLLNQKQISFGEPKKALAEENLRRAFGHIGHEHTLKFLITNDK